ncbi:hypothetical protein ABT081_17270 [Streptomyces sp. NPDC002238]|uniref:hypothetical protein n=1 Tax=Streptomyces sp. NPDC002238 TaxID=3156649 RepID=UPI003327B937
MPVVTVVPSAARTTSGDTGAVPAFAGWSKMRAQLNLTSISGLLSSLDVVIEDTHDGTNWNQVAAFTTRAATGRQVIDIVSPFTEQLRVRWSIAGTNPSATFSVLIYGR